MRSFWWSQEIASSMVSASESLASARAHSAEILPFRRFAGAGGRPRGTRGTADRHGAGRALLGLRRQGGPVPLPKNWHARRRVASFALPESARDRRGAGDADASKAGAHDKKIARMRPRIVGDIQATSEGEIERPATRLNTPIATCERWRRTMSLKGIEPSSRRCGSQPVSRPNTKCMT